MPYEALRPPDTTTDVRTGQPFLRVPLANSDRFARISPQDHQRVLAAGFSPNWYLHLGYVTTYAKGRGHARVARVILGLTSPQDRSVRVSYVSGDHTDLRRLNLTIRKVSETKPRYGRDDRRPQARSGAGWRT